MLSYSKYVFYLLVINTVDISSAFGWYPISKAETQYYNYQILNGDKVVLQVYYESLCPGCIQFHTGALHDTYEKMGSYIDLKEYPYGNAQRSEENGQTVITCQHGEEECYGNKLHACAIDILMDISKSESYLSCMMTGTWGGSGSTDMDATKCGEQLKIDAKPIMECAKNKKGEDLLEYYGKETDKVADRKYVPWALVNGEVFNVEEDDLMTKICEALSNPPPQCK